MTELTRRSDDRSAFMVVWSSVTLSALRLSSESAKWLILWHLYGYKTIVRDHLAIVRVKPELVVSNGDILRGWGFAHFLIGVSIWLPTTMLALTLLFKWFTPQWYREYSKNGATNSGGSAGVAATLVMFFCIPGLLSFAPAMVLGLSAATLGLLWLRLNPPEAKAEPVDW